MKHSGRNILVSIFALITITIGSIALASEVILVNRPVSDDDKRYVYSHKLISMALDITSDEYGPAEIAYADQVMIRQRALTEMELGENIHLMAELTQPLWEENLITIRIPIRKGISGFRIFLIKREDQPLLSSISSLEQLKALPMGVMRQWSTAHVLNDAQFNLVYGTDFQGLFTMLAADRFTTFGRGIDEVFREYETYKVKFPNLQIEENIVHYIPSISYIFVTPKKPELAQRIEKGLEKLVDNGQFDKLFNEFYSEAIVQSRLSERRLFEIPNRLLTDEPALDIDAFMH